ncbi:adenylate kinase [Ranunculus cassubicifolius]
MNGITLLRSALTQFRFTQTRSFGAAAVQLYDYSDDEDDNMMGESERSVSEKGGVQWVFIGNPGAKKHLYAEKLSQLLQVPHISMASLVRQELNPSSSLYKQIANAISEGKLVQEDVIFGLLSKRLEEGYCRGETGFILDGIPRNRMQAEILDQIADIDLVVNFKCSDDCWLKKHLGGSICIHCQSSLAMQNPGSTNLNWLLQQTQLKPLIAEDVQKEKLRLYAEQKKPLEDYYRERKKLIDFQVASGPKDTWQGLLSALHLKHMNAVCSSNKLTA